MRRGIIRLLALAIIIAAAYKLNQELEFIPTITEPALPSNQATAGETQPVKPLGDSNRAEGTVNEEGNANQNAYEESDRFYALMQELSAGFQSREDRFSATYGGDKDELSDNLTEIIRAALRYDDYSAYILESYVYTIRSWGNRSTITVEARYRETKEETAAVDRKVDEVLAQIIKPGMNDHEKIKAIHDWVVTNVEYDQSLTYYTAYDAITLGQTVCQGYSLLGYKMLDKAGISVLIAEGSVNTGEHAWNMVLLDDHWYHLDLTWNDPVGVTDSRIRYNYYLRTDDELRKDHSWTRQYPAATKRYADTLRELEARSTESEALRYNKLKLALDLHWLEPEYTVADAAVLREAVQAAVRSRTNHLQFRYLDSDGFADALKAAFEGVNVSVGYRASYEPYGGEDWLLVNIHLEY